EEREIHYTELRESRDEVIVDWHGLTRTGRDMDDIKAHLAHRYRVICHDTIRRGHSQLSPRTDQEYCLEVITAHANSLLDQLGRAVAPPDRDLDAPHRGRPGDAALRSEDGAAVRAPSARLRSVGSLRRDRRADVVPARRDLGSLAARNRRGDASPGAARSGRD